MGLVTTKVRVLSGMQPSGRLHLGNWKGALENWVRLQTHYDSLFMVADWHALTSGYHQTSAIPELTRAMVLDWLAAGIDPEQSVVFVQSAVPQHAELALLLGMITPLGWLERVPSYKDKLRELAQRDIHTYGFLGYPVLMTADIVLYRAGYVPVGQDQVPHVELTREIVRRFNGLYGDVLVEPEALLTEAKVLPGLDGRKMSKSYDNTIALSATAEEVTQKVRTMLTDPARVRKSDPGNPDVCPVYHLHQVFSSSATVAEVDRECRAAGIGCVDCKRKLAEAINTQLEPIRERRQAWESHPETVDDLLVAGAVRAQQIAEATMHDVRQSMHLTVGRE
ncbi:tryptophanyl-tRNA synthetase [Sulfobacillus acidophilus TPY]|nr:tryptophanyl-tRNA synthetase [Sulfobacillus acidophilus TPY]